MSALDTDALLGLLPYFQGLRPDERARVASRMVFRPLAAGEVETLVASNPRLVVVAEGRVAFAPVGRGAATLFAGDVLGDVEVMSGRGVDGRLTALEPSMLAVLGRADLDALFVECPALPLAFLPELGRELRWRNDLLRDVCLARTAGLPPERLAMLLESRRRRFQRRRRSPLRRIGAALVRLLFAEPSRLPSFWVFAGATIALVSARTVVAMILRRHLQDRLFALIATPGGHPIHVHHFNYGLLLISTVGLLSLVPAARRWLRALAFLFGFGLGLVVDEFALFWNLDPNYYQPSSRLAAALVLFALGQVVYFRALWIAIGRRLLARVVP